MRFYIGEFKRAEDADYDIFEHQMMCEALGNELIDDMIKYSARAWKTYGNTNNPAPSYYLHVQVYCEITDKKHATWFTWKYPQIKSIDMPFREAYGGYRD